MIKEKIYTQVEFLGPILGKTAFDFMLERAAPYSFSYKNEDTPGVDHLLELQNKKQDISVMGRVPSYERYFESIFHPSLLAKKTVPPIISGKNRSASGESYLNNSASGRKVLFRPDTPYIRPGIFGNNKSFRFKFDLLVSSGGKVIIANLTNPSEYPDLDRIAEEHIKKWVFEPCDSICSPEEEVQITLTIKTNRD